MEISIQALIWEGKFLEFNRATTEKLGYQIEEVKGSVLIETLAPIEADSLQMRQLFQNLIGNALKFHREGIPPEIKITRIANLVSLRTSAQP